MPSPQYQENQEKQDEPIVLPKNTAKGVPAIAVPTHGPGGVFSIACSTTIRAPALACLEKVLDVSGYGAWNTFVPSASVVVGGSSSSSNNNDNNKKNKKLWEESLGTQTPELVALLAKLAGEEEGNGKGGEGEGGKAVLVPGTKVRFNVLMSSDPKSTCTRAVDLEVTVLESFSPSSSPSPSPSSSPDPSQKQSTGKKKGKGYRVAWKGTGFPSFLLRSERVQEFIEEEEEEEELVTSSTNEVEGKESKSEPEPETEREIAPVTTTVTKYRCWETFAGALAYVLPKQQLENGFERWMQSLKNVVENTSTSTS